MAKILVFQHVPYEPLGTLDPLIREHRHRIRYVNFSRENAEIPAIENYDALIILGGPMNIDQADQFPHIHDEVNAIQEAIKLDKPILGICLGSQLIASALGADVKPAEHKELGWYSLRATEAGLDDPLIKLFQEQELIFQWHGYSFDVPEHADLIVKGNYCKNQAFRYKNNVYGFQFHLEITADLIERWTSIPSYLADIEENERDSHVENILTDTQQHLPASLKLSRKVFNAFLDLIPTVKRTVHLKSR